eukprot:TRINITY_DN841_c0_g1_i2.p1 TRINITY_DN841_c0_g1~~TRINITY_DN841_c0_g1_i2.p1  ORF type:complete len:322 (+),score=69.67 TRINITY_DN841_c0_g1_i2:91-1056(+)
MRATAACALLSLGGLASGHGAMNLPPARNQLGDPGTQGGCIGEACMWFSQGCTIGCPNCTEQNSPQAGLKSLCASDMKPTITDPKERTMFPNTPSGTVLDVFKHHPWRAPGSAPVLDSCGVAGGSSKNNSAAGGFVPPGFKAGDRGSRLPPTIRTVWPAGSSQKVAWGIAANHGGGYQYRLCPSSEPLTEECFFRTPLEFVGSTQWLRYPNGTVEESPAVRVSRGTLPQGSTWTKNPIPPCKDSSGGYQEKGCQRGPMFPPPAGCDATCWGYQNRANMPDVMDEVRVPASLPPGDYVLSWRWDCEHTPQVWQSCSDITVTA